MWSSQSYCIITKYFYEGMSNSICIPCELGIVQSHRFIHRHIGYWQSIMCIMGKCSKISNTSCLLKRSRQTAQTWIVWSGSSLFAILVSFMNSSLDNQKLNWEQKEKSVQQKEKSVEKFRTLTVCCDNLVPLQDDLIDVIWVLSRENLSSGNCHQVRLNPVFLAIETIARLLKFCLEQVYISYFPISK